MSLASSLDGYGPDRDVRGVGAGLLMRVHDRGGRRQSRRDVGRGDLQDAVSVETHGDQYLLVRGPEGRQPVDDHLADPRAEVGVRFFALEDGNHDPLLARSHGIKRPPGVKGQLRIARQERQHDRPASPALGIEDAYAERVRGDVRDGQVLQVVARPRLHDQGAAPLELTLRGEQRRAEGNRLIRAHRGVRRPAEDLPHQVPDRGNPRGAADREHEIDVLGRDPGRRYDIDYLLPDLIEQRPGAREKGFAPDLDPQQKTGRLQGDGRPLPRGQVVLGPGGPQQPVVRHLRELLERERVRVVDVDAVSAAELLGEVVEENLVEIGSAEVVIAASRPDRQVVAVVVHDGDVEGAAAEVHYHAGRASGPALVPERQ